MGVTEIDTMLMTLGVCRDMNDTERDVVTTQMIRGFNDLAREANTNVTGGQTVMNPWPLVGGVAMSVRSGTFHIFSLDNTDRTRVESEIIRPIHAVPGDVLILTKPLGTQIAVNFFQWRLKPERWARVESAFTVGDAAEAFLMATESMTRLNRNAARLMHKYHAHSATDVTGFGLLRHARNQAKSQLEAVDFEIHTLPIIRNMVKVNAMIGDSFKLLDGLAAETSGGLLLCIAADRAEDFIKELHELDGKPAWIVGRVVTGTRCARIVDNYTVVEVGP